MKRIEAFPPRSIKTKATKDKSKRDNPKMEACYTALQPEEIFHVLRDVVKTELVSPFEGQCYGA